MTEPPDSRSEDADVGARVRRARSERGLSLRTLARLIGVSPATLSQIENGRTRLTVPRLTRIADALDTTAAEILALEPGDTVPNNTGPGDTVPNNTGPGDTVPNNTGPDNTGPDNNGPTVAIPSAASDGTAGWRRYGPLGFDPVLQAALEDFLAIGYHGATVRGIAARAGLSVSGIYHYYASKQQMLARILDLTMDDLLVRAGQAQAEGSDPVQRFGLLVENLVLFHTHRRDLGFVGASEMRSLDADNRPRIAEQRTRQQRMVDHEVDDAVRTGRFRTDHPHEAARAVVTMCTALPTWWRPDGALTPEQLAAQYVGIALDVMGSRG